MTYANDNQVLAAFFGRLQAASIHNSVVTEYPNSIAAEHPPTVTVNEQVMRVVNSISGETMYSGSVFTTSQEGTRIRNAVVYVVAKAMKTIFTARQYFNQNGNIGQKWVDFSESPDLIPTQVDSFLHYVGVLKKESEKGIGCPTGARIIGSASLKEQTATADIDDSHTVLRELISSLYRSETESYTDQEVQTEATKLIDSLVERRRAAKQELKAAVSALGEARKTDNTPRPPANAFHVLKDTPLQPTLSLDEAKKAYEKAVRLADALDWLMAELELIPDDSNQSGKLFYGLVRRLPN